MSPVAKRGPPSSVLSTLNWQFSTLCRPAEGGKRLGGRLAFGAAVQLDSTIRLIRVMRNRKASRRVKNATDGYIGDEHVPHFTCRASSDRHIGGIGSVLLDPASRAIHENHSRSSRVRTLRSEWRALCARYLRQGCGQVLAPVPVRQQRILST